MPSSDKEKRKAHTQAQDAKRKTALLEIAKLLDLPPAVNTGKLSARSVESAIIRAWRKGGEAQLMSLLGDWLHKLAN